MTTDDPSNKAGIIATQSETNVRRANLNGDAVGAGRVNGNGHEALDLAETVSEHLFSQDF